jgi:Carboxypeptidase regulatory-like domain
MQAGGSAILNSVLASLIATSIGAIAQPNAPSSLSAAQHTVSGVDLVVFDSSGKPIPKAKVIITNERSGEDIANGLTNQWGNFEVSQVPPGAYKVAVQLVGFEGHMQTLLIQEHLIAELTIILLIKPVPDRLRHGESLLDLVVKDENGAVIPNASVSVMQVSTGAKFEGATNQAGTFCRTDLASGDYTVMVRFEGFKAVKAMAILAAHESPQIVITLSVAPTIIWDGVPTAGVETIASTSNSEFLTEPAPSPNVIVPASQSNLHRNRFERFFSALVHKPGL